MHNWQIIDKYLADVLDGHTHDGGNSAPVDPVNLKDIYERLERLERRVDQHDLDLRALWEYIMAFMEVFLRHDHTGADTLWLELFQDFSKSLPGYSTTNITPARQLLTLPNGYVPQQMYHYVGKPFDLLPDPTPGNRPTTARLILVAREKGFYRPYMAIGANLDPTLELPQYYPGAQLGTLLSEANTQLNMVSRHDYKGKRLVNGVVGGTPSQAFHMQTHELPSPVVVTTPPPKLWVRVGGGIEVKQWEGGSYVRVGSIIVASGARPTAVVRKPPTVFSGTREFSLAEYDAISYQDGRLTETTSHSTTSRVVQEAVAVDVEPEPLHDGDRVLSWNRETNTFHWYYPESQNLTAIPIEQLGPLPDPNLVEVAATYVEATDTMWILKTRTVRIDSPAGFFEAQHQLVRWQVEDSIFAEGPWWTSGRMLRRFWPARVIAPTKLEYIDGKIYCIFEADPNRAVDRGITYINYYQEHPEYQWFPFRRVYSEQQIKTSPDANYAIFNPGILGTVGVINTGGSWVPESPARIIPGRYDLGDAWAALDTRSQEAFEGANDKVYAGRIGSKLYFYQAFVQYNGEEVWRNESYKDPLWAASNPSVAWNGIVTYDLNTDQTEYIAGDVPFRVNTGATIRKGKLYLYGGTELAEMIYDSALDQVAAASDRENRASASASVLTKVLVNRVASGLPASARASAEAIATTPLIVNVRTAIAERLSTASAGANVSISSSIGQGNVYASSQVVISTRNGIAITRGRVIINRIAIRIRFSDPRPRVCQKVVEALVDGERSRQMYVLKGLDLSDPDDLVRVYVRCQSLGRPTPAPGAANATLDVFRAPTWVNFPLTKLEGDAHYFEATVAQLGLMDEDELRLMLSSTTRNDRRAGVPSQLRADYIYAEVEARAKQYIWEWTSLPQGPQAAIVLECYNTERVDLGIEAKSLRALVNSSLG